MSSRRRALEKKYGLCDGEYAALLETGSATCWICKEPESVKGRSLAIDHDHETGAVRGLLCTRCNQVVGRMNDDPELLRSAAAYLDQHRASYSDACTHSECKALPILERLTAPDGVFESRDGWTRFHYTCANGHTWLCGWSTRGAR